MVHVLHPSRLRCRRRAGHHTAAPAANLDPCLHDKLESRSCHKQDLPKPAHTLLPNESIPNAHPTRTTAGMRAGKKQLPVGDHNSSARSSRNTDTVPKIEPHPPRGGLGPPGNTSTGKAGQDRTGQGRAGPGRASPPFRQREEEEQGERGGERRRAVPGGAPGDAAGAAGRGVRQGPPSAQRGQARPQRGAGGAEGGRSHRAAPSGSAAAGRDRGGRCRSL